ncbi:hypothetical protein C8R45DRAFT_1041252 [Mycena sanguinolenta]|nr:hypothetical protein C8R45DRAFT_1041252 [Mycena sanguinolenta]
MATSTDAVSPPLPPELERSIFEAAALSWPRCIPRLMLVAWRVKSWVQPLLYRTIAVHPNDSGSNSESSLDLSLAAALMYPFVLPAETLLSLINFRQPWFFRDSVRNLLLAHDIAAEEASILAACSGIENLLLSAQTSLVVLQSHFDRPLKRLHGTLEGIFGSDKSMKAAIGQK